MPKKNSIGSVLLILGVLLSASLYFTLWLIRPQGIFELVTISLQDTYLTLHPVFILTGVYAVATNLCFVVIQAFKRFSVNTWNVAHISCLFILGGFIFYGREVLRFGFAFIGRRLDSPNQSWTLNETLTYSAGRWEKLSQNLPEALLVVLGLFVVLLTFLTYRRRKRSA